MQAPAMDNTDGYISSYMEIFAWIMTFSAYEALWQLLYPSVNPYGWGHDFWYNGYAKERVKGHKMGIVSRIVVKHEQNVLLEGQGRTDNTRIEDKWNAVLAQERHYKKYLHIDLAYYRKTLDISNGSWNGAVKGFIPKIL